MKFKKPSKKRNRPTSILVRARKIRFLLLDVDGVLTDGTLWMDDRGREMKAFSIYDGQGIRLLRAASLGVGLLSGRISEVVTRRAKELGIDEIHQGMRDKLAVYERILERLGLSDDEVAYVGDDLLDLPVLSRVGLPIAPPNAVPEVIRSVCWVTLRKGGEGAVRDVADLLLEAKKK